MNPRFALALVSILALPPLAQAQTPTPTTPPAPPVIILDAPETPLKDAYGFNFDNAFHFVIGGFHAANNNISRNFQLASAAFQHTFSSQTSVHVEAGYFKRHIQVDVTESRTTRTPNPQTTTSNTTLSNTVQGLELRSAYFEHLLSNNLLAFSVGRRKPVWGQFKIFSPVNLMLPLELQSKQLLPSKQGYRAPQDHLSVSWLPSERFEVSAYWFPITRFDPQLLELLEQDYANNTIFTFNDPSDPQLVAYRDAAFSLGDPFEQHQAFAARAVYYGDKLTFGLTCQYGPHPLSVNGPSAILPLNETGVPISFDPGSDPAELSYVNVQRQQQLYNQLACGAEIAVPIQRWTFTAEIALFATEDHAFFQSTHPANLQQQQQLHSYLSWLQRANNLNLNDSKLLTFAGVGANYESSDWSLDFSIIAFRNQPSSFLLESRRQQNDYFQQSFSSSLDRALFPVLSVARRLGNDRQHTVGFLGGALGPLLGASLFYTSSWHEDARVVASIDAFYFIGDEILAETFDQHLVDAIVDVDLPSDINVVARLGLVMEF